jgi:hypothetical protein
MAKSKKPTPKQKSTGGPSSLYELEVAIISGMISEAFAKANRHIVRTIEIRGDQTLEQLHEIIFKAFDRFDEHLYEFQVGGKGPMDPKARRYGLRFDDDMTDFDSPSAGDVRTTTIASLRFKKDDAFGYWFDFGDDWWHQINVLAIHDEAAPGKFPRVTARTGESPPQYPDLDDDEADDEDDDGDDDDL